MMAPLTPSLGAESPGALIVIHPFEGFVKAGGLVSYGPNCADCGAALCSSLMTTLTPRQPPLVRARAGRCSLGAQAAFLM